MPIEIAPEHFSTVRQILRQHLLPQAKVWVFGSRAGGKVKRFSDLDLAVDAGRPLTLGEEGGIKDAVTESALPWRVDVVDMQTVQENFRRIVDEHKIPLDYA